MNTAGYLTIALIFTFILQYVISFFFTFKIRETARGSYTMAALWGGLSTLLFTFTLLLNALIPSLLGTSQSSKITYIVISSIIVTIGNVLGTLSIPTVLRWYENKTKLKVLVVEEFNTIAKAKEIIKKTDLDAKNEVKAKKLAMRTVSKRETTKYREIKANEKSAK